MAFNKNVRDVAARARYAVDLLDQFGQAYEAGASRDIRVEIGGREVAGIGPGTSPTLPAWGNIPWGLLLLAGAVLLVASR